MITSNPGGTVTVGPGVREIGVVVGIGGVVGSGVRVVGGMVGVGVEGGVTGWVQPAPMVTSMKRRVIQIQVSGFMVYRYR